MANTTITLGVPGTVLGTASLTSTESLITTEGGSNVVLCMWSDIDWQYMSESGGTQWRVPANMVHKIRARNFYAITAATATLQISQQIGTARGAWEGADAILPAGQYLTPTTWTRTGGRYSIGLDLELAVNEGDMFCKDGEEVSGIMSTATSMYERPVKPNLTGPWTVFGAPVTMTADTNTINGVAINSFQRASVSAFGRIMPFQEGGLTGATAGVTANVFGTVINNTGTSRSVNFFFRVKGGAGGLTTLASTTLACAPGVPVLVELSGTITNNDRTDLELEINSNEAYSNSDFAYGFCGMSLGLERSAQFPDSAVQGDSYGDDLATTVAPSWPATGRTLTVSRLKFSDGVISSVSTTPAPTAGNYVLDGSTDGDYQYITRVSNNVLTAGQISDTETILEAKLAATAEICPDWILVGGAPIYTNGVPDTV